jgi:hypothetical protein
VGSKPIRAVRKPSTRKRCRAPAMSCSAKIRETVRGPLITAPWRATLPTRDPRLGTCTHGRGAGTPLCYGAGVQGGSAGSVAPIGKRCRMSSTEDDGQRGSRALVAGQRSSRGGARAYQFRAGRVPRAPSSETSVGVRPRAAEQPAAV